MSASPCAQASASSSVSRSGWYMSLNIFFAMPSANVGPFARSLASCHARASSSSSGTTALTSHNESASAAPPAGRSIRAPWRARRPGAASGSTSAPPSGTSPTLRNTFENFAVSEAMMMSQASAMLQPMPATAPRTAHTTGFSMFARLRTMRCASFSRSRAGDRREVAHRAHIAARAERLAARTCSSSARTAGSRAARSNDAASASRISTVSALILSGPIERHDRDRFAHFVANVHRVLLALHTRGAGSRAPICWFRRR